MFLDFEVCKKGVTVGPEARGNKIIFNDKTIISLCGNRVVVVNIRDGRSAYVRTLPSAVLTILKINKTDIWVSVETGSIYLLDAAVCIILKFYLFIYNLDNKNKITYVCLSFSMSYLRF
jgi:hypothetical protein